MYINQFLSLDEAIKQVQAALRTQSDDKFASLTKAFLFHDKDRSGFLDVEEIRDVCYTYNVPVTIEIIETLLAAVDVNQNGKIDYEEFVKFLDWRSQRGSVSGTESFRTEGQVTTAKVRKAAVDCIKAKFKQSLQTALSNARGPAREQAISIAQFLKAAFD